MAVRLLFPTYLFHRNLLQEGVDESRVLTESYMAHLVEDMDSMRRRDPKGRQVSNQYTGWQSHDGVEKSPAFTKCMNRILALFNDEVLPFHGLDTKNARVSIGNSWANINDKGAWNMPHLHNGCWYSGVFYIKGDGDEGRLQLIETDVKVVADMPHSPRTPSNFGFECTAGELILFPSGAMHMVEPNPTDKERYSISFNINMDYVNEGNMGNIENFNRDEFVFDLDVNGNPITNS